MWIQEFSSGGRGVQVSLTKKSSDKVVFLSPQLNLQKLNGQFHRNLSFFKFPRGSNIFQGWGGGGGVQLLIPYRNPYDLWFSRGSGPSVPPPPLDPHLEPISWALWGWGASCLSSVGTYILGTVGQGCRLFKRCQNLHPGHCV